jgi:5-methylthioribose kinase
MSDYALLVTENDVVDYLVSAELVSRLALSRDAVSVVEVTAGNMNRVFIATGPLGSLAIKQAPPFVQVAGPGWPIDPARIGAEARAYDVLSRIVPDSVPFVVSCDLERFILVMEDLSELRVLRDELVGQVQAVTAGRPVAPIDFVHLGTVVGRFVGELSRATGVEELGASAHAELVAVSANPELCDLTFDVVLDEPFREHDHNHWHPSLESRVRDLYASVDVKDAVVGLHATFRTSAQALLHGDLHSGSLMVGPAPDTAASVQQVRVFDPEFSFVGPIGLDLGLFWANLEIAAVAADAVGADALATARRAAIDASWSSFASLRQRQNADEDALASVRADAWRFAGAEALRRVVGYAHAADLETLPPDVAAAAQQSVFDCARHWLVTGTPKESS